MDISEISKQHSTVSSTNFDEILKNAMVQIENDDPSGKVAFTEYMKFAIDEITDKLPLIKYAKALYNANEAIEIARKEKARDYILHEVIIQSKNNGEKIERIRQFLTDPIWIYLLTELSNLISSNRFRRLDKDSIATSAATYLSKIDPYNIEISELALSVMEELPEPAYIYLMNLANYPDLKPNNVVDIFTGTKTPNIYNWERSFSNQLFRHLSESSELTTPTTNIMDESAVYFCISKLASLSVIEPKISNQRYRIEKTKIGNEISKILGIDIPVTSEPSSSDAA